MNILVIGSGAREHSIIWALEKSNDAKQIFCIPGNAGISKIAKCLKIDLNKKQEVYKFCKNNCIELVIIGPEEYLEKGLSDYLTKKKINVFGPSQKAARLESSKIFSKKFLNKNGIPTAKSKSFSSYGSAIKYLKIVNYPLVIKADGLAAGKGVFICNKFDEAKAELENLLIKKNLGSSGQKVLIEEFLDGFEISYFAFVDKKSFIPFGYALDHKRAYNNDQGPNTGGMWCFTPSKRVTKQLLEEINNKILKPTINGIKKENFIFRGILFIGLMISKKGPLVIEYNVRFGDPECQTLLRSLKTDLLKVIVACTKDKLSKQKLVVNNNHVVCVVIASNGYPGKYKKNIPIKNLNLPNISKDVEIFHAGTKYLNGRIVSSGGRVVSVTAVGKNINEARKKAYAEVKKIRWKDGFFRDDIGLKNF